MSAQAQNLWFIFDEKDRVLTRDFELVPSDKISPEWLDDDGILWAFHSDDEAIAFCNGCMINGSIVFPLQKLE